MLWFIVYIIALSLKSGPLLGGGDLFSMFVFARYACIVHKTRVLIFFPERSSICRGFARKDTFHNGR